ncbi:MAG TPA: ABC transporter substrate-binding protein, partial [Polyangiaceae bacterium]|nr:ABC transporter substrate-binding protein [Polyangiaceae bacterium]
VTVWSSRMALEDINAAGGLPVGDDGESRPLVMVVCNSNEDEHKGVIKRGMSHLADDVRVQSVLATLRPRDLQQAFEDHIAKKIFFLSPISLTSTMTDSQYPNGDLVWNLLGQPSDFAPAYAKLLEHLETYLRKVRSIDDDTPIKVAVVTTDDDFDADLYQFVYPRLRFNGLSSAKNAMDSNLAVVELEAADPDIKAAVDQIIAFNPDIIVSAAGDVMTQGGLIAQVRSFWASTGRPEGERPYYILSPYNAGDLGSLITFIDSLAAPEEFMGISAASAADTTLQNAYASRLRKAHPMVNTDTGNYFDAVYTLAYAMVAAHAPLTGPNIAAAMPSLLEGEPFGTRPDEIEDTLAWLVEPEQTIALSGTLGPPDYDPETGVRAATPAVFCFDRQGIVTLEDQVLRYDREKDEFTGTYPCIQNFAP